MIVLPFGANAQEEPEAEPLIENHDVSVLVSWSTAIPMGELTNDVKMTSGRGFQFDVSKNINNRFTYGMNFAWQAFFQKEYEVYNTSESASSGWQRNYVNAILFMATTRYYFSTSANKLRAYLGLEAGATAIENYQIFGMYEYKELEWHFALTPAMGVDIPVSNALGFSLYFKFPNSFKSHSSIHYSWLNTGVGFYAKIR